MIYLIPILLCLFGVCYYDLTYRATNFSASKIILWYAIMVILILIIGFRFEVGGDTIAYMGDYIWRPALDKWELNFYDIYQPGYTFLCAIGKSISPDFYVFQFIHAILMNVMLFYFIRRNCKYVFSALFAVFICTYLYFSTEILREVLAVLIFSLNIDSYLKKQWSRYYLGVLLACFFHISAIFLVVLPAFHKLRVNAVYFCIILATGVAMFFLDHLLSALSTIVFISDKINAYSDIKSVGILADILNVTRNALFPILFCYIVKYFAKKEIQFENLIAVMGIVGIASYFNPIIFSRAVNYFVLFFCISTVSFAVPALKSGKTVLRQYSMIFTILFFVLYGSDSIMYRKYERWVPYYSIFNPISVNRDNYN